MFPTNSLVAIGLDWVLCCCEGIGGAVFGSRQSVIRLENERFDQRLTRKNPRIPISIPADADSNILFRSIPARLLNRVSTDQHDELALERAFLDKLDQISRPAS
jgi:hypothetical protein